MGDAPTRLGAYRVERRLGAGGMGEVFLAWDERLCRHVAIKRVRRDRDTVARRAHFRREALAVARLSHPSIVQVYDVLETEDGDGLVFEHVEGETLDVVLARGALPPTRALRIAGDVADGLAEAHDKGVVHRDLKAANVVVQPSGRPKILDFGIALAAGDMCRPETAGTPYAMSPEQAAGRPVDHRSDLFALGGLIHHMLVGRRPFQGVEDVLHDEPAWANLPGLPDGAERLLRQLLAKPPSRRPNDTRRVATELHRLAALAEDPEPEPVFLTPLPLDAEPTLDSVVASAEEIRQAAERSQRRRRRTLAFGAAAALLAVVVAFFGLRAEHAHRRVENLTVAMVAANLLNEGRVRQGTLLLLEVEDPAATPAARTALLDAMDAPVETVVARGHDGAVENAVWSGDERHFATTSHDGTARTWTAAGELVAVLRHRAQKVWDAAWSGDGRRLVTAGFDGTARIWDPFSGDLLGVLAGHQDIVWSAVWSGDGRRVLTASRDQTAKLWDAVTFEPLRVLRGHAKSLNAVAWSGDGRRVATASGDSTVRLWDAAGRQLLVLEGHRGGVRQVVWSPDGTQLATAAGVDARIWDSATGALLRVLEGHRGDVLDVDWSPDGQRLLTVSADTTGAVWDTRTGERTALLSGHADAVWDGAWSGDGRALTNGDDGTARLWDGATGAQLAVLRGHEGRVWSAAWSADARRVLTASEDGTARIWDIDTRGAQVGRREVAWAPDPDGDDLSVRSPDGDRLATARFERLLVHDGDETVTLREEPPHYSYNDLAWSPDGQRLAVAGGVLECFVVDVETQRILTLDGHRDLVEAVAWNVAGDRLATGGRDGIVRIRDAASGEILRALPHDAWVLDVAWGPGDRVLTASFDGRARIWDAADGTLLALFRHPVRQVRQVAWSPDGRHAATLADDGVLRFWPVPDDFPSYLQARLRARNRLCLEPSAYVESLGVSEDEARRRHDACVACVPAFFERIEGVPLWEWKPYEEAWGVYRACCAGRVG